MNQRIVATLDTEKHFCTNTLRIGILKNHRHSLKYILALLNSKIINYIFLKYFLNKDIYSYQLEQIPVANSTSQVHYETMADYLLQINNTNSNQLISHTANDRVSSHLEEVLNMMVYELYFETHMKENGIDVLQFINPKPIADILSSAAKAEVIKDFYLWYQKPENPVRQRMLLVETRSKDKIALINKSIQQ